MRVPLEVAQVLVNAHGPERPPGHACEVWSDDRNVARHGNHRVSLVDLALANMTRRMGVNVCDHLELTLPTVLPQGGVATGMKGDRTRLTSIGIQVVIAYKCRDANLAFQPTAQ